MVCRVRVTLLALLIWAGFLAPDIVHGWYFEAPTGNEWNFTVADQEFGFREMEGSGSFMPNVDTRFTYLNLGPKNYRFQITSRQFCVRAGGAVVGIGLLLISGLFLLKKSQPGGPEPSRTADPER